MDNEIGAVWRCSNAGRILVVAQSSTDFAEPEVELVAGAAICCRKRADGAAAACRDHELNAGDKKHRSGYQREPKSTADAIENGVVRHSLSPLRTPLSPIHPAWPGMLAYCKKGYVAQSSSVRGRRPPLKSGRHDEHNPLRFPHG